MKKKINKKHDVYFIIDSELINNTDSNQQYIRELGEYVIKSSSKKKNIGVYEIYYKE